MDLVSLRRQHTKWAISQNPVEITIRRTTKVDKGGYFEEIEEDIGPFIVRIFQQGSHIPQETSTLAGTKNIDRGWGILADYTADIKAGSGVMDEFEVSGLGKFQVIAVYPQIVEGQIVGYQADLERVS